MEDEDADVSIRFRSSSFSSELTVNSDKTSGATKVTRQINITLKCALDKKARLLSASNSMPAEEHKNSLKIGRDHLTKHPSIFPFSSLVRPLKIRVFKYLSPGDRGLVAKVCKNWYTLARSPALWHIIDFSTFPPFHPEGMEDEDYDESVVAYAKYQHRTRNFINFLITVRPKVRIFKFAFDIADLKDGWMEGVELLLRYCDLHDIKEAELIWNETPAKPSILDSVSLTWCTSDYKDLMYKHRHRQRYFLKFFDLFTSLSQSLTHLIVPFDWTDRSIRSLSRLNNLTHLVLLKYFIFQEVEQRQVELMLNSTPSVTHLTVEIWTPSGRGLQSIKFKSESLFCLDVSQCRGIKLDRDLHLPNLTTLAISVNPMKGPLTGEGTRVEGGDEVRVKAVDTDEEELEGVSTASSCLYDTLKVGAPCLDMLNDHKLKEGWKDGCYEELECVLVCVCVCHRHTLAAIMNRRESAVNSDDND